LAALQGFAMIRLFEFQKIIQVSSNFVLLRDIVVLTAVSMILV